MQQSRDDAVSGVSGRSAVEQYNARGYAARQRGDLRAAASEYGAAIALDPTHFKSHFNRGFTHDKVGRG